MGTSHPSRPILRTSSSSSTQIMYDPQNIKRYLGTRWSKLGPRLVNQKSQKEKLKISLLLLHLLRYLKGLLEIHICFMKFYWKTLLQCDCCSDNFISISAQYLHCWTEQMIPTNVDTPLSNRSWSTIYDLTLQYYVGARLSEYIDIWLLTFCSTGGSLRVLINFDSN